jgi:ABC-2 type transport system permease protein
MTTPSNAFSASTVSAQPAAPAVRSATRPWYWSVRRELWENRSIYVGPLAVAAIYLFGFLISLTRLPPRVRALAGLDEMHQRHAIEQPYHMAAGLLMFVWMAVGAFYSIEAFQSERRDRSILFWKSMPVSDVTTVLAKAAIPFVILPLLTFAAAFILQWTMFVFSAAALAGSGLSVATYWIRLSLVPMSLLLLYHMVTVHTLLHAPFYAWLMLVSAWARRMAFLWAVLPVLALLALEELLFNTSYFGSLLMYQLSGGGTEAMTLPGTMPMDPMTHVTPGHFLVSPALWIGLIVTAAFLAAAVRLRRTRDPM